ncbi:MAG: acetate kinase [Gemmatimonadaceae bacterium]|nr:acetate kinase [Gemmatimonadaceae bacterium]NUQ93149.1 acetate kinase [Gemmatimonadaceae bacterium]NUR19554.1 acetate kinase [Gemmatimonadaceae bacterium]
MNVLVLNVGSSTLKFQLVRTDAERMAGNSDEKLARGAVERIGGEAVYTLRGSSGEPQRGTAQMRDHRAVVEFVSKWLVSGDSGSGIDRISEIEGIGHRVAHGGERFRRSVLIDDAVLRGIEETIDLAPLHNPHNLRGIYAARAVLGGGVPQVAVFDTAFHQTIPERAYLYALPYQYYRRHRVRRYGFHGTSYRYIAHRYRMLTGRSREDTKVVALHLGNGASACAIVGGVSVDTSMGFTPLEGLVMGTRSGDLDPAILDYIAAKEGLSLPEVEGMLNKQSGLLGISGLTNDMRELLAEAEEHDDRRAWLAIEMFCYRVRKYVGSYLAAMNGADAILFSGGVGENAAPVRATVCEGLEWLGVKLDAGRNRETVAGAEGKISADDSRVEVWVVPTDEELLIARDTVRVVEGLESRY